MSLETGAAASVESTTGTSSQAGQETTENQSHQNGAEGGGGAGAVTKVTTQGKGKEAAEQPVLSKAAKALKDLRELGEQDMNAVVTIKADGKVRKMTVAEAIKRAELADGAHGRMEKAAHTTKHAAQLADRAQKLIRLAESDPDAFLEEVLKDPSKIDAFAEARLLRALKAQGMTEEQKELEQARQERDKLKKEKETREQSEKQTQEQRRMAAAKESLDKEIAEAWKDADLPQDLFYVKQISAAMRDSIKLYQAGKLVRPLTPKEAASIIKGRFETSISSIADKSSPEQLLRLIGEKNFSRLREFDLKRVTGKDNPAPEDGNPENTRPGNSSGKPNTRQRRGPLNEDEYNSAWAKH